MRKSFTLVLLTIAIVFICLLNACGSIKYNIKLSEPLVSIDFEKNISEVDREIKTVREVLLAEQARNLIKDKDKFKKLPEYKRKNIKARAQIAEKLLDEKKEDVEAAVRHITKRLKNFELLKPGMSLSEMRKLGFDVTTQNVDSFQGSDAVALWFKGITPPPPPYFLGSGTEEIKDINQIKAKDINRLVAYILNDEFIPTPNNGGFWAWITSFNREIVLGYRYEWKIWTKIIDVVDNKGEPVRDKNGQIKKDQVFVAAIKGGPRSIYEFREEYESRWSRTIKGFDPRDFVPGF